ncbi:MAG: MarR family transcriptional regulator [Betaproteobacteria bacterium]
MLQASRPQSSAVERRYGVTGAQLWALRELARQPGVRVTDLAAAMALHQSTVSNMIDKLIRKRLIRRERGDEDRRVVRLHLTVAAARVLRAAPTPGSGMLANALEGLPSSALTGLDRQLEALLSRMQSRAPERRV